MNDVEFKDFIGKTLATVNYDPNKNEMRIINGTHRINEAKKRGFTEIPVNLLAYKDPDKSVISYNFGKTILNLKNLSYEVRS